MVDATYAWMLGAQKLKQLIVYMCFIYTGCS